VYDVSVFQPFLLECNSFEWRLDCSWTLCNDTMVSSMHHFPIFSFAR